MFFLYNEKNIENKSVNASTFILIFGHAFYLENT